MGEPPAKLTAKERPDRGNAIYTAIWTGSEYVERKYLCPTIRDGRGQIVPALENAAREAAQDRQRASAGGIADLHERHLSLAGLFRRLLHAKEGKYAVASPWKADMERHGKVIQAALGRTTLVADLRHSHYRKLWRRLAELHVESGRFGPRAAEIIVGALRSAVAWAQGEELVEAGTGLPAREWKRQMREEWEKITRKPIAAPAKPRYTKAEQAKLWAALPQADPRLRLAVELGAELRLGQIPRSRRSDVEPYGDHAIGSVRVHGSGKKRGALVVLSDTERAVLVEAMTTGFLSDLEERFQVKGVDYFLIPAGKLAQGKARVSNGGAAWGRTGMRKAWRALETLAGVAHMDGRNWYGLRRLHADLAEDAESDERVLDTLGGWTDSATRRAYQEQGRTDIREKATAARSKIRPKTGGG